MIKSSKILVTGFGPFLGEKINPSEILLEWLKEDFSLKVDTLLLPVSFKQAPGILLGHLSQGDYDLIILLGQAGGRAKINLERVALNWVETGTSDEDSYRPRPGVISQEGDSALFSTSPLTEWRDKLIEKKLPVEISLSAGGFVCNYLYYHALQWVQENKKTAGACFIHVPYLPEQVLDKPGIPSMELEQMKIVLAHILSWYLKE